MVAVLAVVGVLSGCGDEGTAPSGRPEVRVGKTADEVSSRSISPRDLRVYLSAWEASWRRLGDDLGNVGEEGSEFSDLPDASWKRARRSYGEAAAAYRNDARRLVALSPPAAMRTADDAYLAAIRRQAARFQTLADAFAGDDPRAMEDALEALEWSQLEFDVDGAKWERAVIKACKATGVAVPAIVRREYISNGHRTRAK